jgi:serine/threonine protein kinase
MTVSPFLPISSLPSLTPSPVNVMQHRAPVTINFLIQRFPNISAAELHDCLVHYKEQPGEEQARQKNSWEALAYSILQHQDEALREELFETLPEEILLDLLNQERVAPYLFGMQRDTSLMSIFVTKAICEKRDALLQALLILFAENAKNGFGSGQEAYNIARQLLHASYCNEGIDFVLMLPQKQFEGIMCHFVNSDLFSRCDGADQTLLISFFERGFERVFRWFEAHSNEALMCNLNRYVESNPPLFEAVKTCMQKAIAERDFSFLYALFNVFSEEQQKRFGEAISQWQRSSADSEANVFHWLFSTEGQNATTIIQSLINSIPFIELAAMFETQDVHGRLPSEIDPSRYVQLQGWLSKRIARESDVPIRSERSFDTLCAFLFFADMCAASVQVLDLEEILFHYKMEPCQTVAKYYRALKNCFSPFQGYEKMDQSTNDRAFLKLACLFGRGSKYFRAALLQGRRIEKQLRATLLKKANEATAAWPKFLAFKKMLYAVAFCSFDSALHDLQGKTITYENMEIFFNRRLTLSQLKLCIRLMESSQDPRVRNFLPVWKEKLQFWNNFPTFLSERSREGKITREQVKDIIEKLQGMKGASLSADGIHLSSLGTILKQYGDDQSKRVGVYFSTIFDKLLQYSTFQNPFPSNASLLRVAYFIAVMLPQYKCVEERVLSKGDTDLPFLLQYNPLKGRVYLLSKLDKVSNFSLGSYKIATPALALSLTDPGFAEHKIRLFTISPKDADEESFLSDMQHMHCHEIKILRTFQNHECFQRAESIVGYAYPRINPFTGTRDWVPRDSLIVDPAIPLSAFLKKGALSFENQVFVMSQLCSALADLHERGYFHGDLKIENVMMVPVQNQQNKHQPILIDFSFSVPCEVGKPIDPTLREGAYADGIYGSIWLTAPEFLGVRNFQGDHFKLDMFALGFVMYHMIIGVPPDWKKTPEEYKRLGCPEGVVQSVYQRKLTDMVTIFVNQTLDPIRAKIEKKEMLTPKEDFMRILCSLLDPNPKLRASAKQASEELKRLLNVIRAPQVVSTSTTEKK